MKCLLRTTTTLALLGGGGLLAPACLNRPLEPIEHKSSVVITEVLPLSRVDKIDILLAIDDSGSMADKQAILAVAVPDLVEGLVNPPCLDKSGDLVVKPEGPLAECPEGSRRDFEPVLDIHIGILSSSLGGRGSPWMDCDNDDGELLDRIDGGTQDTFQDMGFLAWQPESTSTEAGLYREVANLNTDLNRMVVGVGQNGCGHEAQMESWYRFLVDPNPYATVAIENGRAVPSGKDEALLLQRKDFLRPDSLVAIIMLSDENDCSYRADAFGYFTTGNKKGRGIMNLVPRSECAADPNDTCCAPCGFAPESCATDPVCDSAEIGNDEQLLNVTCFDQKRRYGIDLLYPTSRYVAGLTQREIEDRNGDIYPNPLLVSDTGGFRGTDRVFLAGIVGVPWQLIARDASDLSQGFLNAQERDESGVWNTILGDPAIDRKPSDPHMIESIHPREGLPGPGASVGEDPLNGHEYQPNTNITEGAIGDLQYACTFALPEPIVCDDTFSNCDCKPNRSTNNPLCQAPDGSYGNVQHRAKAYPGRRQLSVLQDLGDQGIVGSICPAQLSEPNTRDFGYSPAIGAIIERLKQELGGPCLSRSLTPDSNDQVACIVLEGRTLDDGAACDCDAVPGRTAVTASHRPAVLEAMEKSASQAAGLNCFCEIAQLRDGPLAECQSSLEAKPRYEGDLIDGWCYVDATPGREVGNEELVEHCGPNERRAIRFVNGGEPINNTQVFITCQQ